MNLALQEIAGAVGGKVISPGGAVTGVSTDTRTLLPGDLFFALRVPDGTANGHEFLGDAAAKGAAGAVVSRRPNDPPAGFGIVHVDDTLAALGRLGAWWRRRMPVRMATVTGSVGKTSTKGMLGRILTAAGPALVAERSYNNEIGVPLTLLALNPQHRYCAVEFAMRGPGEIAHLTTLARPEVGVITNIGTSHIGRLGSREAIARAKGELLPLLPRTGTAVLNREDFFFGILSELSAAPVLSFGAHADAAVRAEDVDDRGLDGSSFTCVLPTGAVRISLRVPGIHCVQNALAASAAAQALGVAPETIAQGLSGYEGEEMRMRILRSPAGFVVIDDSYNAAPPSVEASLRLLASTGGRRIFVFGGMAELGEEGDEAHRAVGSQAAAVGVSHLVVVGELPTSTAEAAQATVRTSHVSDPDEAVALLRPELEPGDTVLVKGSRVARLERVAEGLIEHA